MLIDLYSFQLWEPIRQGLRDTGVWAPSMEQVVEWNRRKCDDDWWQSVRPAYEWIADEMRHAGIQSPAPNSAPIWAWLQWTDDDGRPRTPPEPLNDAWDLSGYEGLDLLHLRIDSSRLLATRFDEFHAVINRWPLSPDGLRDEELNAWLDAHWDDPPEIKRSQWHDGVIVDPRHPPAEWIQTCFWQLTADDIVTVTPSEIMTGVNAPDAVQRKAVRRLGKTSLAGLHQ